MKLILPLNNTKQIFFLRLKYTLFVSKLTILILLSIAHLFAAEEERKGSDEKYSVRKYDDALTKELNELHEHAPHPRNQETINKMIELIRAGADPNTHSSPLLLFAVMDNEIPFIEACLNHGAEVNAVMPYDGMSALFCVESRNAAELLLHARADINFKKILGTNEQFNTPLFAGTTALHSTSLFNAASYEVIETLCKYTPAEPIPLTDNGNTPLHILCSKRNQEQQTIFFLKAAILLWWSLNQSNVKNNGNNATPLDCLNTAYPYLVDGFNEIVYDVQRAHAQLSPIPPMSFTPPMSLKEFDQHRECIEKEQLKKFIAKQLLISITENISINPINIDQINHIANLIMHYAGRNTPYPTYPALAFRKKKKKSNTTKYDTQSTKELTKLCKKNSTFIDWNQEKVNTIETLINAGANPNILCDNDTLHLLSFTTFNNTNSLVKTCLNHKADVNAIDPVFGQTALFQSRSRETAQLLLDAKANINFKKIFGTANKLNGALGAQALHWVSGSHMYPLEVMEIIGENTHADPLPLDNNNSTPLHYLFSNENPEKINNFLLKAATLTWWSLEQLNIQTKKKKLTPRDILEQTAPHLINNFDAIVSDTQQAQAQLSPIPPMLFTPPMSLVEFNQHRKLIENQSLNQLIAKTVLIRGISQIIRDYADKDTPGPTYSSLTFRS